MKEIDLELLDTMTSDEIENIRIEKVKELQKIQQYTALIEQSFLDTQLKMIDLQKKKKEYEISLSKAKSEIRTLKTQIEILQSKFWNAKNK